VKVVVRLRRPRVRIVSNRPTLVIERLKKEAKKERKDEEDAEKKINKKNKQRKVDSRGAPAIKLSR
jgi:hypothetical protein